MLPVAIIGAIVLTKENVAAYVLIMASSIIVSIVNLVLAGNQVEHYLKNLKVFVVG
jgi:hypothetical protein